jgi:hypothetical protein
MLYLMTYNSAVCIYTYNAIFGLWFEGPVCAVQSVYLEADYFKRTIVYSRVHRSVKSMFYCK